jgi:hypothetical protein
MMTDRYQEGYVNGCRKTREEMQVEIDELRARLVKYELSDHQGTTNQQAADVVGPLGANAIGRMKPKIVR